MRVTRETERHPDFKLIYLKNFILRKRNREEIQINYKENMKGELKILQETFRNSKRSGYLHLRKKGTFFGYTWSSYFFMASNIGLVYFKTFGVRDRLYGLIFRPEEARDSYLSTGLESEQRISTNFPSIMFL